MKKVIWSMLILGSVIGSTSIVSADSISNSEDTVELSPKQEQVQIAVENNDVLSEVSWALDYTQPVQIQALAKAISDYSHSDYFSSVKWITRDGKVSLSITPKAILTKNLPSGNGGAAHIGNAWNKLLPKHKNDKNWKNTNGMLDQYLCHAQWASGMKTPWNIEPWRPDVSYAATVAKACNP